MSQMPRRIDSYHGAYLADFRNDSNTESTLEFNIWS